jgi:hypothetical protein
MFARRKCGGCGLDRLVATAVIIALGSVYTCILSKKATEAHPVDALHK